MSKELECLDRIDKRNYLTEREHKEFLGVVEQAIKEYEAIKNAEPSEALKSLDYIVRNLEAVIDDVVYMDCAEPIITIKQALIQAEQDKKEKELLEADLKIELNNKKNAVDMFKEELTLNRELKKKEHTWDIVVSKRVDLQLIKSCSTVQEYYEKANRLYGANYNKELLTEQEFTTLKEVLE